jgi:hypothetical protein
VKYNRMLNVTLPITETTQPSGLRCAYGIDGGSLRCGNQPSDQTEGTITGNNIQDRLNELRWNEIHELRNSHCDISDELAPADRYAYARKEVSKYGPIQFLGDALILVPGEQAVKAIVPDAILQYFREGNCPVSPASKEQLIAGWKGAFDGLLDNVKKMLDYLNLTNRREKPQRSGNFKERFNRGEIIRTDTLERRERDFFEGREWA